SVGAPAQMRVGKPNNNVHDVSFGAPLQVRTARGKFDSFSMETTEGCVYGVRMFRQ
ncbi:MAG: hypothetical protein JNL07_03555, partial [Rhodospirillales bacterium]|nr:hypothetical protein [Rhodospirillales bacterium]